MVLIVLRDMVLMMQRDLDMVLVMQGDLDMLIELISLIHSIKYSLRYTVLAYILYLPVVCFSHLSVTETATYLISCRSLKMRPIILHLIFR